MFLKYTNKKKSETASSQNSDFQKLFFGDYNPAEFTANAQSITFNNFQAFSNLFQPNFEENTHQEILNLVFSNLNCLVDLLTFLL